MSENILVVEYEPRYTERVQQALSGQSFSVRFAKDGEEALRAIDVQEPALIVISSVVPKISTPELIRLIRERPVTRTTPILLTVSGYNGKTPRVDAQRMGASDILPKPYSETDFLGKIQQVLGVGQLTSNEIFGDLVDDGSAGIPKKNMNSKDDVDKLIADTLSGVRPQKKKEVTQPGTVPRPATATVAPAAPASAAAARPKTAGGSEDIDRMLQDTLSGLEKKKAPAPTSASAPAAAPASPPAPIPVGPARVAAPPAPPPAVAVAAAPQPKPVTQPPVTPPAPPKQSVPPPAAPRPAAVSPSAAAVPAGQRIEVRPNVERVPVSQSVITPAAAEMKEEEEPADGVLFGQYVLLEKIATGGMAEVWKARMRGVEGFQKIVAIKKILPHLSDNQDFIEMFVDEAKLAAQLNHNNIIHIYDLGKIQNSYYIAMEYVDGSDLKTILKKGADRDQPITVELALFIASKIAAALDYAHRKRDFDEKEMGLVHRDVSPQNVLISQEGDIKLCDFGIAKAASKASHTQAGALKGKLQYMSPEQAWGKPIDRRSDIFALAAVLFEMLTGRKLFTGENEMSIIDQVRDARVIAPSDYNDEVTPEIDKIVLKALHKEPSERYQTAGDMARDLDSILYSFKPTPASADLAIYMHRLSTAVPVVRHAEEAPVEAARAIVPAAVPAAMPPAHVPMPAWESASAGASEPKRSVALPLIAAVVVLAAIGGGFFYMRSRPAAPAANVAAKPAAAAPAVPAVAPTVTATTATTTTGVPATGTVAQQAALDPNLVNQEVQKRLAAERQKLLDQQAQIQQQQQTATVAPPPRAAAVVPTATQAAAPPPTQTVAPAPEPPPPVATASVAPPVDTAPPVPRVREGDLIPAGTEGLVAARLLRRANVPYPPMARAQRVQGIVVMSVLVSERGQVLDVKVLRGISRGVGLNEAATQMMRSSTFSVPTKDGIRVKAWTTVPVEFKL